MTDPRAFTPEEVRDQFLHNMRGIAEYWASRSGKTTQECCKGAIFSVLSLLDGSGMGFPAVSLSLAPHPDDKEYCKKKGENWYEPGMVFNDAELHALFLQPPQAGSNPR